MLLKKIQEDKKKINSSYDYFLILIGYKENLIEFKVTSKTDKRYKKELSFPLSMLDN